jgi:hypothetical protein
MSARIIDMKKAVKQAPDSVAVEQMHDPGVPLTVTQAYVKLVYCMAAWHDRDAAHQGKNRRDTWKGNQKAACVGGLFHFWPKRRRVARR